MRPQAAQDGRMVAIAFAFAHWTVGRRVGVRHWRAGIPIPCRGQAMDLRRSELAEGRQQII